jgi:hypothetical protein
MIDLDLAGDSVFRVAIMDLRRTPGSKTSLPRVRFNYAADWIEMEILDPVEVHDAAPPTPGKADAHLPKLSVIQVFHGLLRRKAETVRLGLNRLQIPISRGTSPQT